MRSGKAATAGRRAGKERKTAPHYLPAMLVGASRPTAVQEMKFLVFTILAGSFPYLRLFF
jgi:hypothetical protein